MFPIKLFWNIKLWCITKINSNIDLRWRRDSIFLGQTLNVFGYSRKKKQRGWEGVWGHTFLNPPPPPWTFSFFYFTSGNSRQNKAPPLEVSHNCVASYFFLVTLGNSTSLLIHVHQMFQAPVAYGVIILLSMASFSSSHLRRITNIFL